MRKALVTIAVGEDYVEHYNHVAPTFRYYADEHGWDLHLVSEVPQSFVERYSRPERPNKAYCCWLYKLVLPRLFEDYDLVFFVDSDCVINPKAPCVSSFADDIPSGGFAAAPDIYFEDRAKYFPWFVKYHYDEYIAQGVLDKQVPDPTTHINAGVLLFKPKEVRERWQYLLDLDSWMKEEDRLNVYEVQAGRVLMLPRQWHCAYMYEKGRRGLPSRIVPNNNWIEKKINKAFRRLTRPIEAKMMREIVRDNYITHFLLEHATLEHIDVDRLLAEVE